MFTDYILLFVHKIRKSFDCILFKITVFGLNTLKSTKLIQPPAQFQGQAFTISSSLKFKILKKRYFEYLRENETFTISVACSKQCFWRFLASSRPFLRSKGFLGFSIITYDS